MANLFYLKDEVKNSHAFIEGSDAHHIKRTLRKKEGDEIPCFYGKTLYTMKIKSFLDERILLEVIDERQDEALDAEENISLYLSLPKPQTLSDILPMLNELGVNEVFPTITERSFLKTKEKVNVERYQKIILESSKQCCRFNPLILHPPLFMNEIFRENPSKTKLENSRKILCYEHEKNQSLQNLNDLKEKNISIFIGPEGGFAQNEADLLIAEGFNSYSLSPYILRVQTAVATAIISVKTLKQQCLNPKNL